MLTTEQLDFLKGVVTDSGYPYYVVYPEPFEANNNLIHIYLSSKPIVCNGKSFTIYDGVYLQMHHNNYITQVGSGDYTFEIPVDDSICYTSTAYTPLYPSIFQSSGTYTADLTIDYKFMFFIIFCACLLGSCISKLLFGGGRL